MRKRVCIVTTTPFIANAFLRPHLLALKSRYDVTLAINTRDGYPLDAEVAAAAVIVHVPIERNISLLGDIAALWALWGLLRRGHFDLVHTVAPKAGLLGMLAAFAGRVRVRLHTFQGEVWASKRGVVRALFKAADRLVASMATHCLVVSHGEQAFLEEEGVLAPTRSTVLRDGSISGVDVQRFHPNRVTREEVRDELEIGGEDLLIMYVGRIARDKGVLDLAEAFAKLSSQKNPQWLVFVGPDEDRLRGPLEEACRSVMHRVRFVPYTRSPERYLSAADIVCLPSYREGFGLVLIEAGACGVPVLASRLYGIRDAVVEGVTGLFHEAGNIRDIVNKLSTLISDPTLRQQMGQAGRERAETRFRTELLVAALADCYAAALGA